MARTSADCCTAGVDRDRLAAETGFESARRGVDAHETVGFSVDAQGTYQRERLSGPVGRVAVVEVVSGRPAAGVGVDGDQRVGRGAQGVLRRRRCRPCGRKKRCGRQNRYGKGFLHSEKVCRKVVYCFVFWVFLRLFSKCCVASSSVCAPRSPWLAIQASSFGRIRSRTFL